MEQLSLHDSLSNMLLGESIEITAKDIYRLYNTIKSDISGNGILFEKLKANQHRDNYIYNDQWIKEYTEPTGNIVVRKNSERKRLAPGSYYEWSSRKAFNLADDSENFVEWIYQSWKVDTDSSPVDSSSWLILYGNRLPNVEPGRISRFYFNLQPKKHQLFNFLNNLRYLLNYYQIPFRFKCLNKLEKYKRSDSGVLYVQQNHFNVVIFVINELYRNHKDILNYETPFFTYRLADGIGFGENPFGEKESFGENRSRVIFEALSEIKKYDKTIIDQEKTIIDEDIIYKIIEYLLTKGFDENKFYLNPGTHNDYNFSLFNKIFINHPICTEVGIGMYSLRNRSFMYATKIAFELCKEAIWIDGSTCTWTTVYDKFNKYRLVNLIELIEIKDYLTLIIDQNAESIPIIENTISGIDSMIYNYQNNHSERGLSLNSLAGEETLFYIIKKYVLREASIDQKALNLAEGIINIFLENNAFPINGFGNDYFCPTETNGVIMYGKFLLMISEHTEN
jgi:hypothetical protein